MPDEGPHPGKEKTDTWAQQRNKNPRTHMQISVYFSKAEQIAFQRIIEYWGCSKAEALRTMIRYFDANLGLNKHPNSVGVTRKESRASTQDAERSEGSPAGG